MNLRKMPRKTNKKRLFRVMDTVPNANWLQDLPDEELNKIAYGFYKGEIFSDVHLGMISEDEKLNLIKTLFKPIGLGFFNTIKPEVLGNIGFIYEWRKKGNNTYYHGLPVFDSFKVVTASDADRIFKIVTEMETAMKSGYVH